MERDWTGRDGQRWHGRAYGSAGAMATGGQIPDAGTDIIKFQHPDDPDVYHVVETGDLRDPNEMTDEELQELLDQAKGAEELEG